MGTNGLQRLRFSNRTVTPKNCEPTYSSRSEHKMHESSQPQLARPIKAVLSLDMDCHGVVHPGGCGRVRVMLERRRDGANLIRREAAAFGIGLLSMCGGCHDDKS